MENEFLVKPITERDSVDLMDLAESVGWRWSLVPNQIKILISAGTLIGHRLNGKLISSAGIYRYGPLNSLGAVMVRSNFQGKGLGKSIVKQCLFESVQMGVPVALIATADGYPLYNSLGFKAVGNIHRFDCGKYRVAVDKSARVIPMQATDLDEIIELDYIAFGANRSNLYRILFPYRECGFIVRDLHNCSIQGFGLAVRKNNTMVIGPLVAFTRDIARELIDAFSSYGSDALRIDVPGHQTKFMSQLSKMGYRETMVSPVMVLNTENLLGQREQMFGIIDPIFG
jgi:N-acetylglutamate synthase-like GNAT family acetyltransferase